MTGVKVSLQPTRFTVESDDSMCGAIYMDGGFWFIEGNDTAEGSPWMTPWGAAAAAVGLESLASLQADLTLGTFKGFSGPAPAEHSLRAQLVRQARGAAVFEVVVNHTMVGLVHYDGNSWRTGSRGESSRETFLTPWGAANALPLAKERGWSFLAEAGALPHPKYAAVVEAKNV